MRIILLLNKSLLLNLNSVWSFGIRGLRIGLMENVSWSLRVSFTWETFIREDFKEKKKKVDGGIVNGFEFSFHYLEILIYIFK